MARTLVGWLSIASGAAMLILPRTLARLYALPAQRPKLVRLLGARDVLVGAGMLIPSYSQPASLARALADAGDVVLMVGEARGRRGSLRGVRGRVAGGVLLTCLGVSLCWRSQKRLARAR